MISGAMDNITTVMLPKQVDSETSASVETLVISALRPGGGVIVDGSEVTYMSAAGVRVFARALHHAAEMGARVAFCRFTGAAADCLLVSGFTELFDVVDTVEEAARQLR
jgi:anti-anti-sigma factor